MGIFLLFLSREATLVVYTSLYTSLYTLVVYTLYASLRVW